MKIAFVTPYKVFNGGVETVTKQVENLFLKEGHHVTWLTLENYVPTKMERFMTKILSDAYLTSKLYSKILVNYDLVICNGEFGFGISHPFCINVFHGSYLGISKFLAKKTTLKEKIGYKILENVQRIGSKEKYVVAVSDFVRRILNEQQIKVDAVIANCVDTEKFKPTNSIKMNKYLFVGGYNYYAKGIDILLELAEQGINIDCVTNVKPPLPLNWIKSFDNNEMPQIYNRYKGLIFPSRFEASGMVTLEAMASGLPVLVGNVGVGVEILNQIPEFVIDLESGDTVRKFLDKISVIEKNQEKFSSLARDYVLKNHSISTFENSWLETIKKIQPLC
jgi:glycosyltransferase involved in cell wall biosynthesis